MSEPQSGSAPASRIFDEGRQAERTALSWRRAGLSMCVGALATMRIFPAVIGPIAFVPAGVGLALALVVLFAAQVRYRRDHAALMAASGEHPALSGGGLVALTAVVVLGLALCAAVVMLIRVF